MFKSVVNDRYLRNASIFKALTLHGLIKKHTRMTVLLAFSSRRICTMYKVQYIPNPE